MFCARRCKGFTAMVDDTASTFGVVPSAGWKTLRSTALGGVLRSHKKITRLTHCQSSPRLAAANLRYLRLAETKLGTEFELPLPGRESMANLAHLLGSHLRATVRLAVRLVAAPLGHHVSGIVEVGAKE